MLREEMRAWRFYDHFRTDAGGARAPAADRHAHAGAQPRRRRTWPRRCRPSARSATATALDEAVDDAFPGARVSVRYDSGWFEVEMQQHGLLRPLKAAELSDGTLRYLLWVAALLTPRPPGCWCSTSPRRACIPTCCRRWAA